MKLAKKLKYIRSIYIKKKKRTANLILIRFELLVRSFKHKNLICAK